MRKRKKIMVILLSFLCFVVLVTIIPMVMHPYRRPQGMVRNHILRITPIGTDIEDVIDILQSRDDFGLLHIDFEGGFRASPAERHVGIEDMGEMLVSTGLGVYRNAWHTWPPFITQTVGASWIFNEDGKLIEVLIRKIGMF
jgi:hypothetical protein